MEKDVLSPRRLTHWANPANSAFNLGPTQLVLNMDPIRPNILEGLPFQTGVPLLHSTGFALQFLRDLSFDIHRLVVPLMVQGSTNTEGPVKLFARGTTFEREGFSPQRPQLPQLGLP